MSRKESHVDKRRKRLMTAYCLIFGLLFILMILGTAMGSVRFSPRETLDALFGRSDDAVAVSVIRNIRSW